MRRGRKPRKDLVSGELRLNPVALLGRLPGLWRVEPDQRCPVWGHRAWLLWVSH